MPLDIPTTEQYLYSQLAICESLTDYIRKNTTGSQFDEEELIFHLESASESLRAAFNRMRFLIKRTQEEDRE